MKSRLHPLLVFVAAAFWLLKAVASPVEHHADLHHESGQATHSTNAPAFPAIDGTSAQQRWEILLEAARKQRSHKNYTQSIRSLGALLESNPPESWQKAVLLEMASTAEEADELGRAQQILAQYARLFPTDETVPELLFRQGLLFRKIGVPSLALAKFYSVMTTSLGVQNGGLENYQLIVLRAQTEIAETYYLEGKHTEAAEFFRRLLKLDSPTLNREDIHYKLIRCLAGTSNLVETVAQAKAWNYPQSPNRPEVSFLLAKALKSQGRIDESLIQVLKLLSNNPASTNSASANWPYWQQRTGNEIANQLYEEGSYIDALQIYISLVSLNSSPGWRIPALYQIGLLYERLQQPRKAAETYKEIVSRQKDLGTNSSPGLKTVIDMARWRGDFLSWQNGAELLNRSNFNSAANLRASR